MSKRWPTFCWPLGMRYLVLGVIVLFSTAAQHVARGPLPAQRVSSASTALPDTRMPASTIAIRARFGPVIE